MEHRVLDGKQRLTTLIKFAEDEFETPETLSDINLSGYDFSDLPQAARQTFMEYVVNVENLPGASEGELSNIFDRLNRNVSKLNAQELRNAKYGGAFISLMVELAENGLWTQLGIVTKARQRRMYDVELVSELYIVCMDGVQEGKNYLDRYYAANEMEIENRQSADALYKKAVDSIDRLNGHINLSKTRLKNVADFYSLWSALVELHRGGIALDYADVALKLDQFVSLIEDSDANIDGEENYISRYILAARQGSNKKANRVLRKDILQQVMFDG